MTDSNSMLESRGSLTANSPASSQPNQFRYSIQSDIVPPYDPRKRSPKDNLKDLCSPEDRLEDRFEDTFEDINEDSITVGTPLLQSPEAHARLTRPSFVLSKTNIREVSAAEFLSSTDQLDDFERIRWRAGAKDRDKAAAKKACGYFRRPSEAPTARNFTSQPNNHTAQKAAKTCRLPKFPFPRKFPSASTTAVVLAEPAGKRGTDSKLTKEPVREKKSQASTITNNEDDTCIQYPRYFFDMHRQNIRALSLIICTFTYLMIGAAIFDAFESTTDAKHHQLVKKMDAYMQAKYNFTKKDRQILDHIVVKSIPHKAGTQWRFAGAFYFATVVITTVGYGHSTPATIKGKAFCIFYAMMGIPLNLVMFQSIGERLNTFISYCLTKARRALKIANPKEVSMSHMIMVSNVVGSCVVLLGTYLFNKYENWGYFDSFYYCFITLTTIGFGDYVAMQTKDDLTLELFVLIWIGAVDLQNPGYVVFSLLFILFGMAIFAASVNLFVLRFMASSSDTESSEKDASNVVVLAELDSLGLDGGGTSPSKAEKDPEVAVGQPIAAPDREKTPIIPTIQDIVDTKPSVSIASRTSPGVIGSAPAATAAARRRSQADNQLLSTEIIRESDSIPVPEDPTPTGNMGVARDNFREAGQNDNPNLTTVSESLSDSSRPSTHLIGQVNPRKRRASSPHHLPEEPPEPRVTNPIYTNLPIHVSPSAEHVQTSSNTISTSNGPTNPAQVTCFCRCYRCLFREGGPLHNTVELQKHPNRESTTNKMMKLNFMKSNPKPRHKHYTVLRPPVSRISHLIIPPTGSLDKIGAEE